MSCFLLLAYLSIYVNPATTALPALFGLAYPYIAAANIVMVLIWLVLRRWYALLSADCHRCRIRLHTQLHQVHQSGHGGASRPQADEL
ncbi:MAG: hypothetical protein MZV63_63980 [Marinilabiliales bacterium]|nr:hypothetical protein [Marinilabiliales bacterium]